MENQLYTVAEEFTLPSGGLIYNPPITEPIKLRAMTGRDEMKRQAPSNTPFKTLAEIIQGCIISPSNVKVYDLCLGDYEFLLHKLRVITYGEDYAINVTCPYCGENIDTVAKLDSLAVQEFDADKYDELCMITLPKSNKQVKLKIKTPRILEENEQKVREYKRKYKNALMDFDTLVNLTTSIEEIDGVTYNPIELENIIGNMHAADLQKLLKSIETLNSTIGLENEMFVSCTKCNGEIKTFFRFGPEFFRPSTI